MNQKQIELGGQAIQKLKSGDSISDHELIAGLAVLDNVLPALMQMGERFYLAYSELNRCKMQLESYMEVRQRRD